MAQTGRGAWVFEPHGLTEPIEVKVARDQDWIELRFDPLTAAVENERSCTP